MKTLIFLLGLSVATVAQSDPCQDGKDAIAYLNKSIGVVNHKIARIERSQTALYQKFFAMKRNGVLAQVDVRKLNRAYNQNAHDKIPLERARSDLYRQKKSLKRKYRIKCR